MKRLSSTQIVDVKMKQCKVIEEVEIIKLPIKYIIINEKKIYQPICKYLHFFKSNIKFNIGSESEPRSIRVSSVKSLTFSIEKRLFCMTKTSPNMNLWCFIGIKDISQFRIACQTLVKHYTNIPIVESMSKDLTDTITSTKIALCDSLKAKNREIKTVIDTRCLNPDKCLNDAVINFYLLHIYNNLLSEDQRQRSHFFNLFFNTKLIGSSAEQLSDTAETRHARVAKWTKSVDIFDKDFLIVPVIEETHWFIVIVCFPWMAGMVDYNKNENLSSKFPLNSTNFATEYRSERLSRLKETCANPMPCVLIFDSLNLKSRSGKVKLVREYLATEWRLRRADTDGPLLFDRNTMRGYCPKVPQQSNLFDCGVYMLHYVEIFFREPIGDFSLGFFEQRLIGWFDAADVSKKRSLIRTLVEARPS